MLVVLSDMLLADGTAGDHNLSPQVFSDFVDQIAVAHAKVRQVNPNSQVQIVYAGNIFEMRRTHFWFLQNDHKPWHHFDIVTGKDLANPPKKADYLDRSIALFNGIMTHRNVAPIKGILGDRLADRFGGNEPTRVYLPGASDRLINMHPALRARVIDFLGLDLGRQQPWNEAQPFPHGWLDPTHGVFIRHGHEWDAYSFEGDPERLEDYSKVPMSDLITCELFARLTYEASLLSPSGEDTAQVIDSFRRKLEQVDNVRPVSSVVKWLARHFETPAERKLLKVCIERSRENFLRQEYCKWWLSAEGHDKLFNAFDEADRIEWLLDGLKHLWMGKRDLAMAVYDKFVSYDPYANYYDHAAQEPVLHEPGSQVRFIVYGHTHKAEHVPLGRVGGPENARHAHYVNVGSLRPTHTVTRDGKDFFVSESLDFAIFYRPDERAGATEPTFELRTVTRSRL